MKRLEKLKRGATLVFGGITLIAFQNFSKADKADLGKVNESIRLAHARELLGHEKYDESLENVKNLNQHILNRFEERLPAQYKYLAPKITKVLIEESTKAKFDPVFVLAVIETESKFNPLAIGTVGERGLMQIRPETAAWLAKKYDLVYKGPKSLEYPAINIKFGVAYMKYLRQSFSGHASKYVSAYNVGPRKLRQMLAEQKRPQEYATKVMGNYKDFYAEIVSTPKRVVAEAQL
jgi:soluble lytic murein transglycosylase